MLYYFTFKRQAFSKLNLAALLMSIYLVSLQLIYYRSFSVSLLSNYKIGSFRNQCLLGTLLNLLEFVLKATRIGSYLYTKYFFKLQAYSTQSSRLTQLFCLYSMQMRRYVSSFQFYRSICLLVQRQNAVLRRQSIFRQKYMLDQNQLVKTKP